MRLHRLTVLKFGSSVARAENDLSRVVHEIYRWVREGHRVLAVVSALGTTTDDLLERSRAYGDNPNEESQATLVATGEATAAALLGLALDRAGIHATVLDAGRIELIAEGPTSDSWPCTVSAIQIFRALEEFHVAVIPGFVARTRDGGVSLLGRGGSDLTALFLAQVLRAAGCRLIKDVNGIYERDPADQAAHPRRYHTLTWDDALQVGGEIVQKKAIRFAQGNRLAFEVASLNSESPTTVGPEPSAFYPESPTLRPLRVGLLCLGTVGLGVYQLLTGLPQFFDLAAVAVRRPKRIEARVPEHLLVIDPGQVLNRQCDVVVELMGGLSPATDLMAAGLERGIDVVTANKSVIARSGRRLEQIAATHKAQLLYSAAVGGAAPMLESVERLRIESQVRSIETVASGTANFILDQLVQGESFSDALLRAQIRGFTEADPTGDLDGTDTAEKLALLARTAFGVDLEPERISRRGIAELAAEELHALAVSGRTIRLVGRVELNAHGVSAEIAPVVLEHSHPLAGIRAEGNGLLIGLADGQQVFLSGKGAGRWPTAESVIADLLAVRRKRSPTCILRTVELSCQNSAETCYWSTP